VRIASHMNAISMVVFRLVANRYSNIVAPSVPVRTMRP
jgi:hypothetical protein